MTKTTPTIRLEVVLTPAVVLELLSRYGKDWHESRLPPESRGMSVSLRVQDNAVELQLQHIRGQNVVWRGSVVHAENGAGSVMTLTAEQDRGFVIASRLGIPLLAAYGLLRGGVALALVGLLLGLLLALVLVPYGWARRAKREAPLCRAILLRATESAPPGTLGRI